MALGTAYLEGCTVSDSEARVESGVYYFCLL